MPERELTAESRTEIQFALQTFGGHDLEVGTINRHPYCSYCDHERTVVAKIG